MPDENDFTPGEVWDEYVWERFLQQQDRNAEKYFQLLEKYINDPDCDEIIAEEMGWNVFAEACEETEEVMDFLTEANEFVQRRGLIGAERNHMVRASCRVGRQKHAR